MYDDEEDVKVYIIYFKKHMYAWTTNKDDKNMFLEQRNKDLFVVKKVIMDSLKYRVFYTKNKDKELTPIPIESDGETYMLIATYKEDQKFESHVDALEEMFHKRKKQIKRLASINDDMLNIHQKYIDAMILLSDYTSLEDSIGSPGKKNNVFNINSLSLFMDIFKKTF